MPSSRPNLTLDEQSFQDLLSAAFTIQEHNDHLQQAQPTQAEPEAHPEPEASSVCRHCGAPKPTDASRCQSCGLDEFRPGERMQRKWASMWLMSQEQVLWPERTPETREAPLKKDVPPPAAGRTPLGHPAGDSASSGLRALPVARAAAKETTAQEKTETIHARVRGESALDDPALDRPALDKAAAENEWTAAATEHLAQEDSDLAVQTFQLSASNDSSPTEESLDPIIDPITEATTDAIADTRDTGPSYLVQSFADLRETLSFHRADLYLGVAVFVAAVALLWPVGGSPQPAALGPWERSLVALGIAEAPPPVIHLQGDPGVEVWVDPHSALYYCPGEEQYGKTADGRITSQREAQMDRFEPAGRSACE